MAGYGNYIKSLRNNKGFTLREVERRTGISNAYLSQLEGSKIKQPSPMYLYKLAELYEVSYDILMEKVGYPVTNAKDTKQQNSSDAFGKISDEEEEELLDYLKFIRKRKRK